MKVTAAHFETKRGCAALNIACKNPFLKGFIFTEPICPGPICSELISLRIIYSGLICLDTFVQGAFALVLVFLGHICLKILTITLFYLFFLNEQIYYCTFATRSKGKVKHKKTSRSEIINILSRWWLDLRTPDLRLVPPLSTP